MIRKVNCSSLHRLDPQNVDHLFMRFYVEGENGKATVRLEMTKVRSKWTRLMPGGARLTIQISVFVC
jgi:hypothetical protein